MKEQQMTEGQSIAKELFDRLEKLGRGTSKAFLASRIDAALAAARAGTGAEEPKSRGEVVAEKMVNKSGEWDLEISNPENGHLFAFQRGIVFEPNAAQFWIRRWIAAAIDSERAAAAEAMREACAARRKWPEDAKFALGCAVRDIRAIPTEGAKP